MIRLDFVRLHAVGVLAMVSVDRIGGLNGSRFADDIATGAWQAVEYQVRQQAPPDANWMRVSKFLAAVHTA